MIINKEHFIESGRLIARQGAMKSGCIYSQASDVQWSPVFFNI